MSNAYHNEVLRKQRVLERKNEAVARLRSQGVDMKANTYMRPKDTIESVVNTDIGQFNQQRSVQSWVGTERERRQYDHTRTGPIVRDSWAELKKEHNFRETTAAPF